jgi:antitoxin component YwqK of YwqJK toxin-antitoxin module
MKLATFTLLLFIASSCANDAEETKKKPETESLIEYKNGIYTEYYPGKKKVRMKGAQTPDKVRNGKWVLLSPSGEEMSVTFFENGKREGHSFVKHPSGAMNYYGEYLHDVQIGIWKFYDEKGKFIKEENHGTDGVVIQ